LISFRRQHILNVIYLVCALVSLSVRMEWGMRSFVSSVMNIVCFVLLFAASQFFCGCTMLLLSDETVNVTIADTDRILLVAEKSLYTEIQDSVEQYESDLRNQGCSVDISLWGGGGAKALKSTLQDACERNTYGGAFFVGNLPAFWYEQNSFGRHEEFPCDVYFMDFDAEWSDGDGDGICDAHTSLGLDIFVSRIDGSADELRTYFEKNHAFRTGELPVDRCAFIFKDNDWENYERGSSFGLNEIYDTVLIREKSDLTIRSKYLSQLSTGSAEYVYQWIHAYPPILCVEEEENDFEYVFISDVKGNNLRGLFYNLFNCSASRFTESNIAMSYLMDTNFGLATIGSTKIGGNFYPKVFHYVLSRGGCWGEAYRVWYNHFGVTDDEWFLGMIILGDPTLTLVEAPVKLLKAEPLTAMPPDEEEIEELQQKLLGFTDDYGERTFDEYSRTNPQFFTD